MLTQPIQRSRWANFKQKAARSHIKLILLALFFILLVNVALVTYLNLEQVTDFLYVAKTSQISTHTITSPTDIAANDNVTPKANPDNTKQSSDRVPTYPITGSKVWRDRATDTCDRQFGNGFAETKLCSPTGLSCYFNPEIVATNCVAESLVIHPSKIQVSTGNETIESVRWREESPEFPVYSPGAFSMGCEADTSATSKIQRGNDMYRDHLAPMLQSFAYSQPNEQCDVTIEQALILTRYEYANVYHTLTDIYNTFQAGNMLGKPTFDPSELTVIFLDGHSQGAMDEYWNTLFTPNVKYIKQFPQGADNICVKHAVFVSPGYGSALSPGMFRYESSTCINHPCMNDFAKFVQSQFHLDDPFTFTTRDAFDNEVTIDSASTEPLISFATRRPYLSHPRVRLDNTERVLAGEQRSMQIIAKGLSKDARFYAWDFTRMSLRDQLRVLYASRVVMGVHGAALSHILYMKPSTTLVELVPPEYSARTHFKYFAAWSGHKYVDLGITNAPNQGYVLNTQSIIESCRDILKPPTGK